MDLRSIAFNNLLGAFLVVNLLHLYLIESQRDDRKDTISYYALKNRQTYFLFIIGHLIGAYLFYTFAQTFFLDVFQLRSAYWFAVIGVIAECTQAFIPARGHWEKYHRFLAYLMAWMTIAIGLSSAISLPIPLPTRIFSFVLLAMMVLLIIATNTIIKAKHFWMVQVIAIQMFYIQMFLMVTQARIG